MIKNVRLHVNADALELADVLGWQVVIKKNEFKTGDLCVYVVTDTVLPEKPEFEFLRTKHFRIKPIRLRGQSSNGICFPLSILGEFDVDVDCVGSNTFTKDGKSLYLSDLVQGYDVTEWLGIIHYEKPIPLNLAGQAYGHLPPYLIMTDEDNLRSYPDAIWELLGKEYYITCKDDGSSGTFFLKDDVFGVCSRRIHLKEDANNGFWQMAEKYNLQTALQEYFGDVPTALQGEVVGPGIQGNPLGLKNVELHLFSILNIADRKYLPQSVIRAVCDKYSIPMVTTVEEGAVFSHTIETLVSLANGLKYPNGKPAEGIVIRPTVPFHSTTLNKQWSGKIINENYKETE